MFARFAVFIHFSSLAFLVMLVKWSGFILVYTLYIFEAIPSLLHIRDKYHVFLPKNPFFYPPVGISYTSFWADYNRPYLPFFRKYRILSLLLPFILSAQWPAPKEKLKHYIDTL